MERILDGKLCEGCNAPITGKAISFKRTRFCSSGCRRKFNARSKPSASLYPHLSPGTIGALHELVVVCDLIKRGYHVFRAVSASCECDLAILKNGKLIRVEVTTGYRSTAGALSWARHKAERYDLMAVIVGTEIHYLPPDLLV